MADAGPRRADIPGWGVDLPEGNRPGVPKARPPRPVEGAHWAEPVRQAPREAHLTSVDVGGLTPVFGTGPPPRGAAGLIRRLAYRVPEHEARRWLLLMVADRVEAAGGRIGGAGRSRPWPAALVLLGALLLARRARR